MYWEEYKTFEKQSEIWFSNGYGILCLKALVEKQEFCT